MGSIAQPARHFRPLPALIHPATSAVITLAIVQLYFIVSPRLPQVDRLRRHDSRAR